MVNTINPSLKILVIASLGALFLNGCQLVNNKSTAPTRPVISAETPSSENKTTSFRQVLSFLEKGNVTQARTSLITLIKQSPDNQKLKRLLVIISEDPKKVYGTSYHEYRVKPGESLGVIAASQLGKSWEFYGLARYNNLKDPKNLRAGQILKIPNNKKNRPSSNKTLSKIKSLIAQRKYIQAANLIVTSQSLYNKQNESKRLLKQSLNSHTNQFKSVSEIETAKQKATSLVKQNIHRYLAVTMERALQYYDWKISLKKSAIALSENDTKEAYKSYRQAAALNFAASSEQLHLKESISDIYHRDAVIKFRNQQLEESIKLWSQILAIYPEHQSAKTFRERAKKLSEQLKNIN